MYLGFPKNTRSRIKEKKKESETDNNIYMYMCLFDFFRVPYTYMYIQKVITR